MVLRERDGPLVKAQDTHSVPDRRQDARTRALLWFAWTKPSPAWHSTSTEHAEPHEPFPGQATRSLESAGQPG